MKRQKKMMRMVRIPRWLLNRLASQPVPSVDGVAPRDRAIRQEILAMIENADPRACAAD
jgi:hypothetical protein